MRKQAMERILKIISLKGYTQYNLVKLEVGRNGRE